MDDGASSDPGPADPSPTDAIGFVEEEAFHLQEEDASGFEDRYRALVFEHPEAVVRRARGAKMRSMGAMFDELAAALQFPTYFGENWAALDDMLLDLDWLPSHDHLLIVTDAHELLADEPDDVLELLIRALVRAHGAWGGETSFRVVFQVPPGSSAPFLRRMQAIGAVAAR
jgi:hypothetical protein